MTKEEYEQQKKEILDKFGPPESDMGDPMNESARRLKALHNQLKVSQLAKQRAEARANKSKADAPNETLKEISESMPRDTKQKYLRLYPIPPVYIAENDLIAFTDIERDVLIAHFEDLSLTHKELSNKFGIKYQTVTALLSSPAYKVLYTKVFDKILPIESLIAIRQAIKQGDSKIILEVARHYQLLQNETLDINNKVKPIEDSATAKMLKEMGDKLIDGEVK
jgi:hypothetical protein